MKDESLKLVDEIWQKGFADGKASALNQFIRDECDKQMTEKELLKLIIQLASLEKYIKDYYQYLINRNE